MLNVRRANIRRAARDDIPALMKLLVEVNMVHHNGRPDLFNGPTTKYTAEELEALLTDESKPVFVAENENGEILGHGFCVVEIPENTRLMTPQKTLYVDDICVEESARGQGVGRAIYEHIVGYAREIGCSRLTLNVWTCNPGALQFYEKMGLLPYRIGLEKIL